MKSMTGFGAASKAVAGLDIDVSVRAVNGRFLDTRLRLPIEYSAFESELKRVVSNHINRGSIDIFVSRRPNASSPQSRVVVRSDLARRWSQAYKKLSRELDLDFDLDLATVARLPEVIGFEAVSGANRKEKSILKEVLEKALLRCDQERSREGKHLQKELLRLLSDLEVEVKSMKALAHKTNEVLKKRSLDRINKWRLKDQVDEQRLAVEIALQVDKSDISEELARLSEHIRSCKQRARQSGVKGKSLDFYSQELLREVNTIGSKSCLAELTQVVVNAKTLIEQIKEQVQNVE